MRPSAREEATTSLSEQIARQPQSVSRRELIRIAGAIGCAAITAAAAAPPKETGLPFEGLLKGKPGFQPRAPMPPPASGIPGFLSGPQLAATYAVYRRAFAELLDTTDRLAVLSRDSAHAADYAAIRRRQLAAGNSVLLHEFFFRNLAPSPVPPSRYVIANMTEHMGSLASWREDFAACARIAEAWAVLIYDPYDDRWHNEAIGEADAGGWIGGNPLVVCAVSDGAWSTDYKDRESYVARFFDHLDWRAVAARYHAVDRH